MKYVRMPIEIESPEQMGYDNVKFNLAESSVSDAIYKNLNLNLNELLLCYGHHLGKPELRELISKEYKNISVDDVLLTASAASALFIVATSLLSEKDHLIVVRPNYATNIETPRAIGSEISFVDLNFENKFALDPQKIKALIKPNTKYISITQPHNPTGTMLSEDVLKEIIKIAEQHNCFLLVDETYRDLSLKNKNPLAATLSDKVISVSSVSKAYGLPGIRIGWIITKNKTLQELFLAAKEQIFICNSVVDEEIAYQFLLKKETHFAPIKKQIEENFIVLKNWMLNNKHIEWVEPSGGVVCFPRIKPEIKIDLKRFYETLNGKYKTFPGPGHWFEMNDRYMRIGFGWPRKQELENGLHNITRSIEDVL